MFNFEKLTLSFQAEMVLLWCVVGLISLGIGLLSYRWTIPPSSRRVRIVLATLRGISIFLVVMLLLQPLLATAKRLVETPILALLVDDTRSMLIEDAPGKRSEAVRKILASTAMDTLKKRYETVILPFGSHLAKTPAETLSFAQEGTNLGGSLKELLQRYEEKNLAGILLLTDGSTNIGPDPAIILRPHGIPVWAVGTGNPVPPKDVIVSGVRTNPIAYVDQPLPIEITLESAGFPSQKVPVDIFAGDSLLQREEATLTGAGEKVLLTTTVIPKSEGTIYYRVSVTPLEGELSATNNSRTIAVKVLRNKIKVLLVTGYPGWEGSFLGRALKSRDMIELTRVDYVAGRPQGAKRFPMSSNELSEYDAIVLVDVLDILALEGRAEMVADWVRKGSSAFIVMGSSTKVPETKMAAWRALVPFNDPLYNMRLVSDNFTPLLTPDGVISPITKMSDDVKQSESAWRDLPPFTGFVNAQNLKPEVQVILRHPAIENQPILTAARVGSGKVVTALGFPLWRWGFTLNASGREPDFYAKFTGNLIRWLISREEMKPFVLKTDQLVYKAGEEVVLHARLQDEAMQPRSGAEVTVEVAPEVRDSATASQPPLHLQLEETAPGVYQVILPKLPVGKYRYSGQARLAGREVGKEGGNFAIESFSVEFENPRANFELLAALTSETGGRFLTADRADSLKELNLLPRSRFLVRDYQLYFNPLFLILLILSLAAEWTIRKRRQML